MKPQITRDVKVIDGTPVSDAATGADKVPKQPSPTPQPLRGSPLAEFAGKKTARAPDAARTDAARAGAFRYGSKGSDTATGPSNTTNLLLAASTVRNVDALRELIGNLLASAKANVASQSGVSLEKHCEALEKAADRVVQWKSWNQQVAGLRELRLAFGEMPPGVAETRLGSAINTAHEKAISSRATYLASQIESAEDFRQVLGQPLLGQTSWPAPLRELAHAAFLEAAVEHLKSLVVTLPVDQIAECHQILSDAIVSSPPWVAYSADEKLAQLEANELLRPDVKAAFEEGERLEQTAGMVSDLAALHALLAEPGIAGPNIPDDLVGLARSELDGNLGLQARPRPEPLAVLATRVGSFTPAQANHEAFAYIFDKVDGIHPPCRRVASLIALAEAPTPITSGAFTWRFASCCGDWPRSSMLSASCFSIPAL